MTTYVCSICNCEYDFMSTAKMCEISHENECGECRKPVENKTAFSGFCSQKCLDDVLADAVWELQHPSVDEQADAIEQNILDMLKHDMGEEAEQRQIEEDAMCSNFGGFNFNIS